MSLLRALVVEWVAERIPTRACSPARCTRWTCSRGQIALRDHFFARSGFTVKPTSGGGGTFYARSIKELKTTWNTDKATEFTTPLLAEAVIAQMETPVLRQQVAALQEQLASAVKEKRATETLQRIWLAITVVAVIFGLIFGIQPRLG